jgi:hypothetical protein
LLVLLKQQAAGSEGNRAFRFGEPLGWYPGYRFDREGFKRP